MSEARYLKKMLLTGFSLLPGFFKIAFYRKMGATIGKDVEIGPGSVIIPYDRDFTKIRIGDGVTIGDNVKISAKYLVLGERSDIKDNTRIWGQSRFSLGADGYIDRNCHLDLRRDITLGNDVLMGTGSMLYTHMVGHSILEGAPHHFGSITIGDRAYFGAGIFVLPGITIGSDAMVGAKSVVTKDIKPDVIVVGNPAREIGLTSTKRKIMKQPDKIALLNSILDDFTKVYDRSTIPLTGETKMERLFIQGNDLVYYIPHITGIDQVLNVKKHWQKPAIVISSGIPQGIREYCSNNAIEWFDMETMNSSGKTTPISRNISQFFGDYGIRFRH